LSNEPLKKLDGYEFSEMSSTHKISFLFARLNAAIDRINKLEAKYEGHYHTHNYYDGNEQTSVSHSQPTPTSGVQQENRE